MQELIKVTEEQGQQLVSARELYDFLGFDKSQWARWSNKNIVNDSFFEEKEDYVRLDIVSNGNKTTDYILKLDTAKEICMLARNEKGKQARRYFINCEKKLKEIAVYSYQIDDPVKRAEVWILEQKEKQKLEIELKEQKPKIEFVDKILGSKDSILVRVYSKILFDEGINIGERKLYKWFRDNGYLSKTNEPYQKYMKYFEIKETPYDTPYGIKINITTLVKPEGQVYFHNKIKESLGID